MSCSGGNSLSVTLSGQTTKILENCTAFAQFTTKNCQRTLRIGPAVSVIFYKGGLKMTADRLLQLWGSMLSLLIWAFLISLIAFNVVPWWVAILGAIIAQLNEQIFLAIVRRVLHLDPTRISFPKMLAENVSEIRSSDFLRRDPAASTSKRR
jgi:hypothetical protein